MSSSVLDYILLTKPRIVLLVMITAVAGLVVEGSLLRDPVRFALVLFAITLTAGSANAFNQYFERDLDAAMARTRKRRPLPLGRVSERGALCASFSNYGKSGYVAPFDLELRTVGRGPEAAARATCGRGESRPPWVGTRR